jgi:excisionase family DNA binding protein
LSLTGKTGRMMPPSELKFEPLLDSGQAAGSLGIHPKTLQKMARAGRVPAIKIGDLWRFRASDLDAWVRTMVSSPSPLVP